jgi:hypothetical protein
MPIKIICSNFVFAAGTKWIRFAFDIMNPADAGNSNLELTIPALVYLLDANK